jgi:hypothetical protein
VGAKNVLELGALGGYSTIWLVKSGAHVTSVEIDPKGRGCIYICNVAMKIIYGNDGELEETLIERIRKMKELMPR